MSLLLLVLSMFSAHAGVYTGRVETGAYLNCLLYNDTPYYFTALTVQYSYSCLDAAGRVWNYAPAYACGTNCAIEPGVLKRFVGPSAYNCNLVSASCAVTTNP